MVSTRERLLVSAGSLAIGLMAWTTLVASAPRHSDGADQDMGSSAYYWLLIGMALIAGFVLPLHAPRVGAVLALPGLVLSPWTAPRGDDDGLWILIVPILAGFVILLGALAVVGRGGRRLLDERAT